MANQESTLTSTVDAGKSGNEDWLECGHRGEEETDQDSALHTTREKIFTIRLATTK